MKFLLYTLLFIILPSCQYSTSQQKPSDQSSFTNIETKNYLVVTPKSKSSATLLLFGGYPETTANIQKEFQLKDLAIQNNVTVVYASFNKTLWFKSGQLESLANQLSRELDSLQISTENLFIGGFSSGGVVALHLVNYLNNPSTSLLKVSGVFVVDSPIDLSQLYFTSEQNLIREYSDISIQESKWIINTLGEQFGNPNQDISPYEDKSVFTLKTRCIKNLSHLKNTPIRMYTEPDTTWWQENRMVPYKETNAYILEELYSTLKTSDFEQVELITTQNKGYRSNGERHPHSWSIVNKEELFTWFTTTRTR